MDFKKIETRYLNFFYVFIMLILAANNSNAQNFEHSIRFKGIADNREYNRDYNTEEESIMGSQVGFEAGTTFDNVHSFRAGLNYFYEFGSELLEIKTDPILYYSLMGNKMSVTLGAFPREFVPKFPSAILSDKFYYYNPTVDGLLLYHQSKDFRFDTFLDWVSRQDTVRREQFMVGIITGYSPNNWLFDFHSYIFHNGGRTIRVATDYIDDYIGGCATVGYNFAQILPIDKFIVKTGLLTSTHRNRKVSPRHIIEHSSYSEILTQYKRFGAEFFIKIGQKQQFALGDQYYNNTTQYVRTNFFFIPVVSDKISARFTWSLHFHHHEINHQQMLTISWCIDGKY